MEEQNQSLKVFIVLSRAFRAISDYTNKYIQASGVNPTEFAVLELLYHKGDQPLQHIGDKILLASGSITYVVDKLEKKQLLKRIACPNDRRVTYAQITEKGKKFLEGIFPEHQERIEHLMDGLTVEEKETVIELLKRIGKSVPLTK
ncbi:MarR family transcriptional regulator [Pradoshia sp. D12]|uniref:MarR family winged helix-turn-helix transcriptional regulator n=1 Tax=Bacillaceae TaxID=186817 RepID=UPI00080AFB3E|nr:MULTISPECIES: MarR family transcriptional regulator [Bacillaceae]OCA89797.1 transcriptional regulator [Bacillus sp. FJAT-27986]QFK70807.1 MarR family transcriptional regulator [Pradoshia sp. D12]TPF72598.1 MarR family transcriptional regulator [Bacillus sp. D12]